MREMTARQRILAALECEETDILPYADGFSSLESQMKFLGRKVMDADWAESIIFQARLFNSDWVVIPAPASIPGAPGLFSEIIANEKEYIITKTFFGALWYWRKNPYFCKALSYPVTKTKRDLQDLRIPDLQGYEPKVEEIAKKVNKLHELGYFVAMESKGVFEAPWIYLRGLENFWMDVATDSDFVEHLIEVSLEPIIRLGEMLAEKAPIDAVWITDDLGTQEKPYFSVDTYKSLFKPWHEEVVKRYHKRGLKVCFHSHGNVMSFFDDFVEVGFDSIDPLDSYDNMDLTKIKRIYGNKVTLKGGISAIIGKMSKSEIRKHVQNVVKIGGRRGFILSSSGGIPPEMSLENFNYYRQVVEEVRRK